MTIRARLTFLYASLLAIVILMFSAATSGVLNWTLRNQVDATLLKTVDEMRSHIDQNISSTMSDGEPWMPRINSFATPGLFVQVWLQDPNSHNAFPLVQPLSLVGSGYYINPLDPEALDQNHQVLRDVTMDGVHMRVVTVPMVDNAGVVYGHIQVASSLHTVDAAIDRLLQIMLIGGGLALIVALVMGDVLSRRALKPIDMIAHAAQRITAADDLSRRIPYDGPPDEIGQLTETFNDTLERLERLFNAQRRFVADVSHEMRTPLTTIQGNVDLMRRIGYDSEAMEAIENESRRMSRLVGDLLLLAKVDAGRLSLEKVPVDLDTLVLEVYNQAHMLGGGAKLCLGTIDQVQVVGDSDRLKQLVLNLVSNGLKYTPPDGTVTLSLSRDDERAYVTVQDTGIGIPAADLPHIFDRFYRVDKARSRAQGGTGLGLSIAKWIADAHGGHLSVTSTPGEGSTFTVSLPVAPSNAPPDSLRETVPSMSAIKLSRSR